MYGLASDADVRAESIATTEQGLRFMLCLPDGKWPVQLGVVGRHNVSNALAAATAAHVMGVEGESIVRGLEAFNACSGRMELIDLECNVLLVEDSYNANPLSVEAALDTLDELADSGQRIAVLGDMLELGEDANRWHREVGALAAKRVDSLILFGPLGKETGVGAVEAGLPEGDIACVDTHDDAIELLRRLIRPGARVLVKGSRGMRMEMVSEALKNMPLCQEG